MSTNYPFPRFGVRSLIFAALLLLSMSRGSLSAATRVWTGASTNNLWLTSGNWTSSILPTSSDDVVFQAGGAQRGNVNDLLASLHSVIFGDGGYTIVGNTVTLTNGIIATNTAVAENLWAPLLVLGANQSFSNLNGGATLFISQLDLHGRSLRLGGAGTNIIGNVLQDSAGGGSLTNSGTGVFLFPVPSGGSTFSGPMTLSGGTNLFTGFQLLSPISWTAGTLGGTGHLGNVTASGGAAAKTLTPEYLGSPGTLSTSNLVLISAVTLAMQVHGTNAGVDYDQISANGNVTLGSATLSLSFVTNLSPIVGTTLTLIKVANGSTLTGTFAGLPEGSTFTNNRAIYQLSYVGGSGHDVTLSVSGLNSTGTLLNWSGAGTNNLWMNHSNWSGNVAPQQGDELVFQDVGGFFPLPQATNFNDFPADTTFDSLHIQLEAGRTNINVKWLGNSVRLNNGVRLEAVAFNALTATGNHIVSNHISLNASQTFSNSLDGVLRVAGGVALGSNTLSVGVRQGTHIFFDAPVTGPGVFEADGDGTMILTASNAVTGSMSVNRGFVLAEHPQALGSAASGPVHVSTNGTLELFLSNTVFTASSLVLTGSLQAPLTNITLSSSITTAGSNATIAVGTSGSLIFSGLLTNNTLLTNSGGGLLYLPPGSVVQGGGQLRDVSRMDVDGSVHNPVAVGGIFQDGSLSGSGQIDSLICTNTSSIAPGSVSDNTLAYSPLRLGSLFANNSVAFSMNIFPNRPGGGATNTQIIVTNAPTLGNSTLNVFAQATLSPNQQFTIVRNLSAAPITNTFLNLPEGSFFAATNGNLGIQISYVGGAGHDVVLTVQSNTPPIFSTPTNSVSVNELATLNYTNVIHDLEPTDTNYNWVNLTPVTGMVLNPTNGVLTWTPQEGQACSNYTILMQVTDSGNPPMSATGVLNIAVQEINQRPVPMPVPPTNILAGHTLTIPLNATDADLPPQPLTWTMVTNPAPGSASVSTIDPFAGTGQFTYSPDVTATNFGTNIFVVQVSDSDPCDTNFPSLSSNLTITVVLSPNRFVTNTNNSGPGSLRQAILDISSNAIGGHIEFAITTPATGPWKIAPTNALPVLGANTFIDGYTESGSHPNTKTNGTDAVILIELSGENIPGQPVLQSGLSGVTIRGLCVNRATNVDYAIRLDNCCGLPSACGTSSDSVEGCFIGTDTSGSIALPNTAAGVHFGCVNNARLGGPDPSQRNLISGNLGAGVEVLNQLSGVLIQNNLIGTDRTGTNALPNGTHGISFPFGPVSGVTIADNVISANSQYGVSLNGTTGAVLVRNKIGLGSDGVASLGNGVGGVIVNGAGNLNNIVGSGTNTADANTVADNNGFGVEVASGSASSVLGNSIFRNANRAVHLESGANSNQAAPVLTSATAGVGSLTVNGTLTSLSNRAYRIEFFHNPDFNPSNQPQAWNFLGFTNVTTAANSNASFSITFQQSLSGGFLTATATDTNGSTSGISDGQAMSLPVPLRFSSITRSGTNLIFSGAGGTSNGTYHMLSSTNIALPISNWTALLTSQFDPNGNFIFSNAFNPGVPLLFYRLATP